MAHGEIDLRSFRNARCHGSKTEDNGVAEQHNFVLQPDAGAIPAIAPKHEDQRVLLVLLDGRAHVLHFAFVLQKPSTAA